jgi:alkylation response protein AidB-like acyl-CoA dehydrogenase
MDFTLDSEQTALRDAVRGLLSKAYDSTETRREVTKTDPGWDEKTWQRLAEMGALGLPFAEEDGGFGAGPVEVSIVAEEIGRVIAPEPYVEAVVLAGGLIAAAGTPAQKTEIIGALAEGQLVPAFAHTEPGSRYSEVATVTASGSGDSWTLTGVKEPVLGGARADLLIVSAAVDGGTGLFLVQPDADGLTRTSYPTFDRGRAAHVAFASTPAVPLGEPGADQSAAIAATIASAQIAYGHESLGAMSFALETTRDYLKTRKQFGVPLMTFQALTFRAADMYVSLELARSTVTWATLVELDGGDPADVLEAASRAKLQVSKAGRHIGQEAIQLHGGIGMTAEYSVGHYMSRLTAIDHALGDGRHHLTALSKALGGHTVVEPLP